MRTVISFLLLSLVILCTGCNPDDTEPQALTKISINSSIDGRLDVFTEESSQLSVRGTDQFGNPYTITSTIAWSSNNDNAKVDDSGLVTPLLIGTSTISATVEELTKTIEFSIWDSSAPRTEVFVSDAANFQTGPYQILVYDEDGENPFVFTNKNLAWPQDILFLEDQELVLISNLSSGVISKHDINSGEPKGNFATNISGPTRMKIGADNLLYVLQWQGNGLVKRYDLDGKFVDNFTSVGVNQSIGLDWDADGNLYVSSFGNASIRKFDTEGNDLGIFIGSGLSGPTNIWFEGQNLIVNDYSGGSIKKFDESGSFIATLASGLSEVEGVDFFGNGDFIVGNGGNGSVKMYQSSGTFVKDFVSPGTGGLIRPNAIKIRKVNQ